MDKQQLATFSMRLQAAFLDGIIVGFLTGLLIAGIAVIFPNDIAFPFYTQTETEVLNRDVKEEGDTTITRLTHIVRQYDIRHNLISECLIEETEKQSDMVTTTFSRIVEPCKTGVIQLDSLFLLFIILYGTYFEKGPRSSTPGKKWAGIRVVGMDEMPLSLGRALWRNLAEFLSFIFCIGYLFALFTSKKQALHDLIARTLVIQSATKSTIDNGTAKQSPDFLIGCLAIVIFIIFIFLLSAL
jgi:uncharacterized RDD family membrane protein YckC